MKKLFCSLLLIFAFSLTAQAAEGGCTTDLAGLDSVPAECGCVAVQGENGAQVFAARGKDGAMSVVRYCVDLEESISGVESISGQDGIGLFSAYIRQIYLYGASIIGIICVLVIVVSGIQISLGGANSEYVNQGKERIMQAMLSMILLFGSALVLRTVNPGFFTPEPNVSQEAQQNIAEALANAEQAAKQPTYTGSGSSGDTGDYGSERSSTSHVQALEALGKENFSTASTGKCRERNIKTCTSLDGLQPETITGAKAIQAALGDEFKPLIINGGTEVGHKSGTYSHGNGYKLDFGFNSNPGLEAKIKQDGTPCGTRSDGAVCYDYAGYKFYGESDHWDVVFGN